MTDLGTFLGCALIIAIGYWIYKEFQDDRNTKLTYTLGEYVVDTNVTRYQTDLRTILKFMHLVGETEKEVKIKLQPKTETE